MSDEVEVYAVRPRFRIEATTHYTVNQDGRGETIRHEPVWETVGYSHLFTDARNLAGTLALEHGEARVIERVV